MQSTTAAAFAAACKFEPEYEGVRLCVHYYAEADSDEFGPWTTVSVVAITVPGGEQDLTILLAVDVVRKMDELARDDYDARCRRSADAALWARYVDMRRGA